MTCADPCTGTPSPNGTTTMTTMNNHGKTCIETTITNLRRWVLMYSRILPNQRILLTGRPRRVSSDLLTRRPAGVNATKSEGISDAKTIVSGQADCPDTIGANVAAMATMNAAAERGKKPERQSLRRGLREPSCRRPRGARLSGTQTLLGNLNVSKSLRLIIVIG
jgi:hypothetical protein